MLDSNGAAKNRFRRNQAGTFSGLDARFKAYPPLFEKTGIYSFLRRRHCGTRFYGRRSGW